MKGRRPLHFLVVVVGNKERFEVVTFMKVYYIFDRWHAALSNSHYSNIIFRFESEISLATGTRHFPDLLDVEENLWATVEEAALELSVLVSNPLSGSILSVLVLGLESSCLC